MVRRRLFSWDHIRRLFWFEDSDGSRIPRPAMANLVFLLSSVLALGAGLAVFLSLRPHLPLFLALSAFLAAFVLVLCLTAAFFLFRWIRRLLGTSPLQLRRAALNVLGASASAAFFSGLFGTVGFPAGALAKNLSHQIFPLESPIAQLVSGVWAGFAALSVLLVVGSVGAPVVVFFLSKAAEALDLQLPKSPLGGSKHDSLRRLPEKAGGSFQSGGNSLGGYRVRSAATDSSLAWR